MTKGGAARAVKELQSAYGKIHRGANATLVHRMSMLQDGNFVRPAYYGSEQPKQHSSVTFRRDECGIVEDLERRNGAER
jgi:hypothetical protein